MAADRPSSPRCSSSMFQARSSGVGCEAGSVAPEPPWTSGVLRTSITDYAEGRRHCGRGCLCAADRSLVEGASRAVPSWPALMSASGSTAETTSIRDDCPRPNFARSARRRESGDRAPRKRRGRAGPSRSDHRSPSRSNATTAAPQPPLRRPAVQRPKQAVRLGDPPQSLRLRSHRAGSRKLTPPAACPIRMAGRFDPTDTETGWLGLSGYEKAQRGWPSNAILSIG